MAASRAAMTNWTKCPCAPYYPHHSHRRREFVERAGASGEAERAADEEDQHRRHDQAASEHAQAHPIAAGRVLQPAHEIGTGEASEIGERVDQRDAAGSRRSAE